MTEQHWKLNLEHKHIEDMTNKKSLQTMNWGSLGPACIPIQFKPYDFGRDRVLISRLVLRLHPFHRYAEVQLLPPDMMLSKFENSSD